jgi:heptosyltransferase-2
MSSTGSPRILVISPNWIGDAVMAQPLLQLLRQQYPEQAIDILAPAWVAPVWRAMAEVDTVIESPFRHGALQLGARWRVARDLRKRGYAQAYVLPNTMKFALVPWLAGIPRRVGYRGEMRYGMLNVIHRDDPSAPRPMVPFYAALADVPANGARPTSSLPRPRLVATAEQIAHALSVLELKQDQPLVVFAPGAEFGSAKRWPTDYFAQLARMIVKSRPDTQIVLLGSAKDRAVCAEVAAAAGIEVQNLAGATSLDQAITLIARAEVVVSNDSGLLHIASALNRPIVALYGPTDPQHAPPFSDVARSLWLHLDCSPCRQRECPLGHHNCMKHMMPEMVWEPVRDMLKSAPVIPL